MKILVTGATGFIGHRLVEKLLVQGHDVVAVTRNKSKASDSLPFPIDYLECDLGRSQISFEKIKDIDAVINLAGENIGKGRWSEEEKQKILDSRAKLTKNLVDSFKDSSKLEVFVQTSAIGFYRDSNGDEWLDEKTAQGEHFLAGVCKAWEEPLNRLNPKIRTVIARIGVVLGYDGGLMRELLPLYRLGAGGILGSGMQWMSWIHVDDVARAFLHLLETKSAIGIVNLTAPNPVRNKTFNAEFARFVGRKALFKVPRFVLKLSMGEKSYLALSSQRIMSRLSTDPGFTFTYPDIGPALMQVCAYEGHFHHQIEQSVWVNAQLSEVFSFFNQPKNLVKVMPEKSHVELIEAPSEDKLKKGEKFSFKIKEKGIPMTIKSEVVDWKKDESFYDRQVKGPFACWNHHHDFKQLKGGTLVTDRISYRFPLGVLGDLAGFLKAKKDIESMFSERKKALSQIFG